jgi:hypothetical protein
MTQKTNYIYNAIVLNVINKVTYDVEIDLGFSHKVTQTIHLYNPESYETSFEENQTKKENSNDNFIENLLKDILIGKKVTIDVTKDTVSTDIRYLAKVFLDGRSIADIINEYNFSKA